MVVVIIMMDSNVGEIGMWIRTCSIAEALTVAPNRMAIAIHLSNSTFPVYECMQRSTHNTQKVGVRKINNKTGGDDCNSIKKYSFWPDLSKNCAQMLEHLTISSACFASF